MIIARTPFRVSLFGGGTDYPAWFRDHGGAVIGGTINKYCYISVRRLPPFFEHRHRIVWSRIELVQDIDEIQHPAVQAVLTDHGIKDGLEIVYAADLPARSGLGSSSSFLVGLLNALAALGGRMMSKKKLAGEAIRIEQDVLKEAVGNQDQVWAAFGGLNRIDFNRDASFEVTPLALGKDRRGQLAGSLMLFFTGFSRDAATIATKQIANLKNREDSLRKMRAQVDHAQELIQGRDDLVKSLGGLMHDAWMMKRDLADGVTTPAVDAIYEAARDAGALGGKLLGAGGGGFILFVVPPDKRKRVRERLKDLIHVAIDFNGGGSKIVVFEPDESVPE
ncbi:MAG: kinase [Rhodospirillales bacterium]|nr:kinase [Rhodospirillales bacterium]